jgi:hypothetical protein
MDSPLRARNGVRMTEVLVQNYVAIRLSNLRVESTDDFALYGL